jgi:hypothetical protein
MTSSEDTVSVLAASSQLELNREASPAGGLGWKNSKYKYPDLEVPVPCP